jgi:hypothetical protein
VTRHMRSDDRVRRSASSTTMFVSRRGRRGGARVPCRRPPAVADVLRRPEITESMSSSRGSRDHGRSGGKPPARATLH